MKNISLLPLAAIPATLLSCAQQDAEHQARYNIVFIMTDDHTAQMMSCYDTTYVRTPNLDRIAADGVKFTQSFVANSLSGPSRACLVTGKHSHKNGFRSNETDSFDGSQQTMPKLMQAAGYETALIGKWHLHTLPTGFDYYEILPGQGDYYNPDFITQTGDTVREVGYVTDIITDKALDWLAQRNAPEKPFLLFVHHKACHRCWLPPLDMLNEYEDRVFDVPATFFDNYEGRPAAANAEMSIAKHMDIAYDTKMYTPDTSTPLTPNYLNMVGRLDSADQATYFAFYDSLTTAFRANQPVGDSLAVFKYQRYMRDYAKVLKSLDDNVGRVLDYLEREGLLENTLVVYTSDQGFYMGEHGWFDKRFMYEESLRTPLVMRLPDGLAARGNVNEMVQNIDHAATFLDIAGADIPDDIQGCSYLPLLQGKHPDTWRKAVYYHYYEYPAEHAVKRHYGIRTERYSLMHFYDDIDQWELYDLDADPAQLYNMYDKEGMAAITDSLKQQLKALQEEYDDPIRFDFPL